MSDIVHNDQIDAFATGMVAEDPRVFEMPNSDRKKATFRLEATRSFKTRSGDFNQRTTKANITAWGDAAEFVIANIKTGVRVFVRGTFETDEYTNSEGLPRRRDHIVARTINILDNSSLNDNEDSVTLNEAVEATEF